MLTNEKQLSVVSAAIKLADALDLIAFAEGINDIKVLKKLKQLGCVAGQGPYFSSPVEVEEMTSMLSKTKVNE
jgi:EAL domain-containing protein (putative c-di-GMP-specific phosphodiesterase class I)